MSAHNLNLSLIIPVFNSENSLAKLIESIVNSLSKTSFSYEIVCINDGSIDRSYQVLQELALITPSLRAINLTKNFGQDNAIMAGLNNCYGDNIVIMDDDLQHPPEEITKFIDSIKLHSEIDVIIGYPHEKIQSSFRNFGNYINDYLNI